MNAHKAHTRQAGVGLIELLVSVLVLSVGLVALARLQIELVRGAADSRARSAAVALAEEKLEDLRSYAVINGVGAWSTGATQQAWSWIDDNAGGRIGPQITFGLGLELEGVRYTRTWQVDDITYTSSIGPAAGIPTDYKNVTVTVAWQDEQGDTQQVQLTDSIMDIPPGNVIAASQPVTARPPGPEILYTPGAAPEIISVPIDVGGGKRRETTKPLPDVVGNSGTHVVRFDVVNYHSNGSEFIVDKREEFITVNCTCQVGTAGPARTPARAVFQNGILRDVPGRVVSKARGNYTATGSSFDDVCIVCCRDHVDYSEAGTNYFYDPTDSTAHQHYRMSAGTTPVNSGSYDEACRLKRVNGVFQAFEDWNLRDLMVLPAAFLTDANTQQQYVDYVQDAVEAVVTSGSMPAKPSGRDTTVVSGQFKQLFGRSLYVDLPDGLASYISAALAADPSKTFADFLNVVPFYEINLTKLADWASVNSVAVPVSTDVVRVTSSDIKDEGENADEYSRGRAEGQAAASAPPADVRVLASLKPSNTGVTGTPPIRPDEDAIHSRTAPVTAGSGQNIRKYYATAVDPTGETPAEHRDDSIIVSFSGTTPPPTCPPTCDPPPPPPPPAPVGIAGDLLKWDGASGNNKPHLSVTGVTFAGTGGSTSGSCTLNKQGNNADFSCTVPSGWSGNIVFAPSSLTFCTASSCAAGTVLSGDQRPYTNVTTNQGNQTTWVMN
jgi:hypothetical protein